MRGGREIWLQTSGLDSLNSGGEAVHLRRRGCRLLPPGVNTMTAAEFSEQAWVENTGGQRHKARAR